MKFKKGLNRLALIGLFTVVLVLPSTSTFAALSELRGEDNDATTIRGEVDVDTGGTGTTSAQQELETVLSGGGVLSNEDSEFYAPSDTDSKDTEVQSVEDINNSGSAAVQSFNVGAISSDEFGIPTLSNTYRFVGKGVMRTLNGQVDNKLWGRIIASKETEIASQFISIASNNYNSLAVSGDLDTNMEESLWVTDLPTAYSESGNYLLFRLSYAGKDYYILLDKRSDGEQTQYTKEAVEEYKKVVRLGLLAGSLEQSFNVYTLYATKPVLLSALLERDENGFSQVISNPNINYTAQYVLNPLFGKMAYSTLRFNSAKKIDYTTVESHLQNIQVYHAKGNKIVFSLNHNYYDFITGRSNDNDFLTEVSYMSTLKGTGIQEYKAKYNKTVYKPKNMIDSSLYIATPKVLYPVENSSGEVEYKLTPSSLYVDFNKKYSINNDVVYTRKNGVWETSFNLEQVGLSKDRMMLYATVSDNVLFGSLMSLDYKEVIVNPTDSQEYYTGRTISFGGQFHESILLQGENSSVLAAKTLVGTSAISLHNFAFGVGTDLKSSSSHSKNLLDHELEKVKARGSGGSSADLKSNKIILQSDYINPLQSSKSGLTGAIIYRNNAYVETDTDLQKWLLTEEAQGSVGVRARDLYALIKGEVKLEVEDKTFEEHNRIEAIKKELNERGDTDILTKVNNIMTVLGMVIIVYSVLLVLLFAVDQVNPLTDASLLRLVTLGRLQGVMYSSDRDFIRSIDREDNCKVLVWWQLVIVSMLLASLGVFLSFTSTLVHLILYLYDKGGEFFAWFISIL